MKLNTVVPEPLRKNIQNSLEYMERLPKNVNKIINFNKLVQAWLSQHRARINYRDIGEKPAERIIEPYFIEPSVFTRSSCVLAYCHLKKAIRTFKIDHIISEVHIEPDTYEIPPEFNAVYALCSTWDIDISSKLETVKLHFNRSNQAVAIDTLWHPSQKIEVQSDGSVIMTLRVRNSIHFRTWLLGLGGNVTVIKPKTLRNQIIENAKSILEIYEQEK
jgi:predicted DNA-binding transcriptional regulator YafY